MDPVALPSASPADHHRADEIPWGRPGHVLDRIPRTARPLNFRRSTVMQSGWWLSPSPDSGAPGIAMMGFDLDKVRQACHDRGWEFGH
jgi:hypothetical protein